MKPSGSVACGSVAFVPKPISEDTLAKADILKQSILLPIWIVLSHKVHDRFTDTHGRLYAVYRRCYHKDRTVRSPHSRK